LKKVFLDTSIFVSGLLEVSVDSACRDILVALANRRLRSGVTAWHCCLEFYSVTTRLPPDYRLSPEIAITLLTEHVFNRVEVVDLPIEDAVAWLTNQAASRIRGGLIYDAHLGQIAARAGCAVVVTQDIADFRLVAPPGVEILSPQQFVNRMV
jgi:predicted nucleic acid-binding protein